MEGEPYWQRDDLVARLRMEASINQGNAKLCGDAADEIERLRLAPDEREAVNAMACYFDTRGNLQMQAWGSLLHTLLRRMSL